MIDDYFERKKTQFKDFQVGSFQTLIQKTHCSFFQALLDLCLRWLSEHTIGLNLQDNVKLEQSFNSLGDANVTKLSISIGRHHDNPASGPELNIIKFKPSSTNKPHGRLVNSQWINISIIQTWIKSCNSRHRGHCRSLKKRQPIKWLHNIRLVDAQRGCLAACSGGERYVALSYVWGSAREGAQNFETIQSNVKKYEEVGALNAEIEKGSIPQTIKDAIHLINLLGQRYLWVDCLCIVQDDRESINFNIDQMDSIYANAYFTIIAADGDNADYGLRGIGVGSQPRNTSQSVFEYGSGKKVLGLAPNMIEYSVWSKRGWTFQEKLFSQRKLLFSNGIVRWMCHCTEWSEDVAAEARSITGHGYCEDLSAVGAYTLRSTVDPSLREYAQLVGDYCDTKLTYEEDILRAFSGITSFFSRTFIGGFHHGLPELFFDLALLWQPRTPNSRRLVLGDEPLNNRFPSWSWTGWKGARGYTHLGWAAGSSRDAEGDASWELISTVRWYKTEYNKTIKTGISNSWQRYRSTCADLSIPLPQGWSRHPSKPLHPGWKRNQSEITSRKGSNTYYYTHEADPGILFRFPIPLRSDNQTEEPKPQNWSTSLSFHTSRANFLTGDKCFAHSIPKEQCLPVCLLDEHMNWAGILTLNMSSSEPTPSRFRCDLLAISAGSALNENDESFYFPEWDFDQRPKSSPYYEFYNVMWVEWHHGIAYRQGLGRVLKETWERQKLEWLDVILN